MTVWELKRRYRARLKFIEEVKKFGEVVLGLECTKSFKKLSIKKPESHFMLFVSDRYRVANVLTDQEFYEFNSLICHPYKNKFYRKKKSYEAKGYDVYIAKASFIAGMPISPAFLKKNRITQCNIIFHEWWHDTSEANNIDIDYSIAEACADIFGEMGSLLFAQIMGDKKMLESAELLAQYQLDFCIIFNWAVAILDESYEKYKLANKSIRERERERCFVKMEKRLRPLITKLKSKPAGMNEASILERVLEERNTALILACFDMTKYYPLIFQLFESIDRNFRLFKKIALNIPTRSESIAERYIKRMIEKYKKSKK